jgi:hypothetical protein
VGLPLSYPVDPQIGTSEVIGFELVVDEFAAGVDPDGLVGWTDELRETFEGIQDLSKNVYGLDSSFSKLIDLHS